MSTNEDPRDTVTVTYDMSPEYKQQIQHKITYTPWWTSIALGYAIHLANYWGITVHYWSTDKRFKQVVHPQEKI